MRSSRLGLRSFGPALIFLALLAVPSSGASPPQGRVADEAIPDLSVVAELPTGTLNAVAVAGDRVFAGLGNRLQVMDLADGPKLVVTGYSEVLDAAVQSLAPAGNHVLAAVGPAGLHVFDQLDAVRPRSVAEVPGLATGVAVAGDLAVVAGETLRTVDVTDPASPTVIGELALAGSRVFVAGQRAYVAAGGAGVHIVDIADPARPALLGTFDSPGVAMDVFVAGETAYVADHGYGLRIVDVSDAAAPVERGAFEPEPGQQCYPYVSERECITTERVAVIGQRAYLMLARCDSAFSCRAPGGVRLVDVSDPTQPAQLKQYNAMSNPSDLAVTPDRVIVASRLVWWYNGIAPCSPAAGSLLVMDTELAPMA